MINGRRMRQHLMLLDCKYNAASLSDPYEQVMYSKIAVIEFCGWLEESLDIVYEKMLSNSSINTPSVKRLLKKGVENTYGFKWERHVLKNFLSIQGAREYCARSTDPLISNQLAALQSFCDKYEKLRDQCAHKSNAYSINTTIYAPSVVLNDFRQTRNALLQLYRELT